MRVARQGAPAFGNPRYYKGFSGDEHVDFAGGRWLRASTPIHLDPETYVPADVVPDEVVTRMNADRGRPHPIPGRPAPEEVDVDNPADDPGWWEFREETRECDWCGEPFVAHAHNARYCSDACASRGACVVRTCVACARPFLTRRLEQIYCSIGCVGFLKRNPANDRRCRLCRRPFRATRAPQVFCSRSCARAWRRLHREK